MAEKWQSMQPSGKQSQAEAGWKASTASGEPFACAGGAALPLHCLLSCQGLEQPHCLHSTSSGVCILGALR